MQILPDSEGILYISPSSFERFVYNHLKVCCWSQIHNYTVCEQLYLFKEINIIFQKGRLTCGLESLLMSEISSSAGQQITPFQEREIKNQAEFEAKRKHSIVEMNPVIKAGMINMLFSLIVRVLQAEGIYRFVGWK